jgi:hypothetical protein
MNGGGERDFVWALSTVAAAGRQACRQSLTSFFTVAAGK